MDELRFWFDKGLNKEILNLTRLQHEIIKLRWPKMRTIMKNMKHNWVIKDKYKVYGGQRIYAKHLEKIQISPLCFPNLFETRGFVVHFTSSHGLTIET